MTLLRVVEGAQVISIASFREVRRPVHELVALVIVADPDPPVTLVTLEPVVVQAAALNVMAVDSALPPFVVSGGENVSVPETLVHETAPVASVAKVVVGLLVVLVLALGLELHAARVAIKPRGKINDSLNVCLTDIDGSPWMVHAAHRRRRPAQTVSRFATQRPDQTADRSIEAHRSGSRLGSEREDLHGAIEALE